MIQTLKVFAYVHIFGHWFTGKTQLRIQKSGQKVIYVVLVLSGHLHKEGSDLAVKSTHLNLPLILSLNLLHRSNKNTMGL